MKWLELLGILISFMEKGERILTAALQHVSALPVPLLRQVYAPRLCIDENHCVFEVFRCLGLSRSVLSL